MPTVTRPSWPGHKLQVASISGATKRGQGSCPLPVFGKLVDPIPARGSDYALAQILGPFAASVFNCVFRMVSRSNGQYGQ